MRSEILRLPETSWVTVQDAHLVNTTRAVSILAMRSGRRKKEELLRTPLYGYMVFS
jgi:hypothetical protein